MPTATEDHEATLSTGAYTFPEASRILRSAAGDELASDGQLRYWLRAGLASTARVSGTDERVLTFDDLVSLELVRRLENSGASLQKVRTLDSRLREHYPGLEHPFAYRVFFTDGARIWAEIGSDDVIEIVGRRRGQYVWKGVITTFAHQIRYDDSQPAHAVKWNLTPWVEIDPRVQFGMPVVRGTRVPVETIRANLEVGTAEEVADWYDLDVLAVRGVRDYLAFA